MRFASKLSFLFFAILFSPASFAQSLDTEPVVGLRDIRPIAFALTGATVITQPGEVVENATILIDEQHIIAVGSDIQIPAGFKRLSCDGKYIYAGFIDAWSEQAVDYPKSIAGYWNKNIAPERSVSDFVDRAADEEKLRKQGFAVRLVAPQGGIIKGSSDLYLLGGSQRSHQLLDHTNWQHAQLTVPRSGPGERYPNSPMGATALLRQAFYDARWYADSLNMQRSGANVSEPEYNASLNVLSRHMHEQGFIFDASNERMALRAEQIAREFSLRIALRGSGREYRDIEALAQIDRPFLIPVNFPDAPNVKNAQSRESVTLRDLLHWDLAPTNPAALQNASVQFCLTTDGLEDVASFWDQVRHAIQCGLNPDTALASLTTVPAELFGMTNQVGTIEKGKLANLAIFDRAFVEEDSRVEECWVAGVRYRVQGNPSIPEETKWRGEWAVGLPNSTKSTSTRIRFEGEGDQISGVMIFEDLTSRSGSKGSASKNKNKKSSKTKELELKSLKVERDRITASLDLSELDAQFPSGISLITVVQAFLADTDQPEPNPPVLNLQLPDGTQQTIRLKQTSEGGTIASKAPSSELADETEEDVAKDASTEENDFIATQTPILRPLGAYGLSEPPAKHQSVVFRNVNLWTCGESGLLQSTDLLIQNGLILAIGENLQVPENAIEFDLKGKHITPGIIDCHSHMGTDGGVNESGQVVTSEVRIGDFIDNTDINIYRQLAGGVTIANILHGSANPIGGQNQVVKLRWGASMEAMKMQEAPSGIKFALGENVKRNPSRYPNTRMGVEQILRDQLLAAREYDADWRRWRAGERDGLPPRVDLQLQALSEVQRGERWIHCHSYRQDEIVATLDVLEEFGIRIGTLQHILEGYKVADRIRQHGAMASAFSDWWAYKFEVFDAIPYNGAIMHNEGVVVSFNSDDRELARHLNTEAAKATKYGEIPEQEALKFVTLNPAKQLRIDHLVGSLEVGKQADLVVWSGRPLSTLSRCEQTWIDGVKYFDIQQDKAVRERDHRLRSTLIQKAMKSEPAGREISTVVQEEDRWVRKDIYCATHGGLRHETLSQGAQK